MQHLNCLNISPRTIVKTILCFALFVVMAIGLPTFMFKTVGRLPVCQAFFEEIGELHFLWKIYMVLLGLENIRPDGY